ncbi:filamentous hemagglutinin N-terminal domain-containing protein [Nostoc sp. XA010]|uniref:two-partner secretion domain-containing protein n=1 Tax=Nostoc sp. XA010 TaxID=2780407 RepID=UPI001E31E2D9|nr:filamentous hemagglutinin N-terminal domain-containing protein [Nostoc sp. XA010]MCC5656590.1 filamentous hemagglutinin N-terminal domain-containing protein [Nostoc sp. XA010]
MSGSWHLTYWGAVLGIAMSVSALSGKCAIAQIAPDSTLPINSNVTPDGNTFNITGGTQAGTNLFHSFKEFSVPAGNTAFFNNGNEIQNIISRVTGNSRSEIEGLIKANGIANLFLINPNGIIFGRNASLDIGGSFVATTANAIGFDNQGFFSASTPNNPELLVVNPSALLFNQIVAAPIQNNSASLSVNNNRSLLAVGGDVNVDGGSLNALGGQVELGGLAGEGTVALNANSNNFSLNFPENVARANVSLTNGAEVNVASGGGGSIAINAENIDVLGRSSIRAGISPLAGADDAQAGDVTLSAKGTLRIENSSIYNAVFGSGNGGDLLVDTGKLIIQDGVIATATISSGKAGDLIVKASDSIELTGSSSSNGTIDIDIDIPIDFLGFFTINIPVSVPVPIGLFSASLDAQNLPNVSPFVSSFLPIPGGNAGNLSIETGRLIVSNGAVVSAGTTSTGHGGNLTVKADLIELSGTSANDSPPYLLTTTSKVPSGLRNETAGYGAGGNLTIDTKKLIVSDGAWVTSGTGGEMPGGELTVNATELVELSGTSSDNIPSILSSGTQGPGNSGKLAITTKKLIVSNGGIISAGTSSSGKAGELTITASDSVELVGTSKQGLSASQIRDFGFAGALVYDFVKDRPYPSGIISGAAKEGQKDGKSGDITVNTNSLSITDGAALTASTSGQGDTGDITLSANTLSVLNDGQLRTSTFGSGQAGDITLNIPEIQLSGSTSGVFAQTSSTGAAGNLTLQPLNGQTLTVNFFEQAQISASTSGSGKGGTLSVNAPESITLSGNGILAVTSEGAGSGRAGDVLLNTEKLTISNGMRVSAAANSTNPEGSGGNLTVEARQLNLTDGSSLEAGTTGNAPGGNLTIQPNNNEQTLAVNITGGATVSAASSGNGEGGTLSINAPESINITGNGSVISAETTGQGAGGDSTLTTENLAVQDGAKITVSSTGSGAAGNLKLNANSIYLNNAAKITADTTGGGGNIFARSFTRSLSLLLRNQSSITTNAKGLGIPGGNIGIDALNGFIIAIPEENSDISANSVDFRGGAVKISAQGIFGIRSRNTPTSESDITATGASPPFNGSVELNTPGIDPNSGLVELPTIAVATEVAQVCDSPGYAQSSFTITGRGGLPPNPTKDVLPNGTVEIGWVALKPSSNSSNPPVTTNPVTTTPERIVEANGLVVNEKGEVVLIANVPAGGRSSWQKAVPCSNYQAQK